MDEKAGRRKARPNDLDERKGKDRFRVFPREVNGRAVPDPANKSLSLQATRSTLPRQAGFGSGEGVP
jgi:hypothetical protein